MEAADWSLESAFQRFYYRSIQSNQIGIAVFSTESTDSLQTSRWYECDPSILKCNHLNGSDHRVVVSCSGSHEECEVNISTSYPTKYRWVRQSLLIHVSCPHTPISLDTPTFTKTSYQWQITEWFQNLYNSDVHMVSIIINGYCYKES